MNSSYFLNLLTDFWVNSVIAGTIAIVGLTLAYAVYQQNRKSVTNQTIAILFISIVFWIVYAHLGDSSLFRSYSLLFNRIVYGALYFWAYALFMLAFVFPEDTSNIKKPVRIVLLSFTTILAFIAIFTDKFILTVENLQWGANNIPGAWSDFFSYYMMVMMIPLVRFIWVYKKAGQLQRRQLKFFFLGLILFIVGVLVIYLVVNPIVGDERFYRYGNYSAVFFIALTAYAILKHQLFNIKLIITETAVILILIISAVQVAASRNLTEGVLRAFFLLIIGAGSYILIRSVKKEIKQREQIELLARNLKKANTELEILGETKDDFLNAASHELNTPISAIEGYLSMILDEGMGEKLGPKNTKYLTTVYNSSKRLAHLVADLLNVSRIEAGRVHILYTENQIEDVVEQAIMEINSEVLAHKHKLNFKKPKEKLPLGWIDAPRITEVVINFIGNAIKYTPDGGKIDVEVKKVENNFQVSVSDNGKGIPKEKYDRIFRKFSQAEITQDENKGTGLGLFISKNLIEMHKGKIWFESTEGKRTSFFFTIPILNEKPKDAHEGEGAVLK